MIMFWSKGRTLITNITKRWSQEEMDRNDKLENLMIFSNFTSKDEGRSRELVCKMNPNHTSYKENERLILRAPFHKRHFDTNQTLLKEIDRILNSGINIHPNSPIHDRIKESIIK